MSISAMNASFSGIHQNMQKMNQAAQEIANPDTSTDASAVLDLKVAEHAIAVNTAAARAIYNTTDAILDIFV